jgi:hypothetical protein
MKLSLTGIKNPSIWAHTHFGSSDHAFRLAVENIVASAAKPNKFADICNRWNRNTSRAFIGLDYPSCKRAGGPSCFYREPAHEI